jgi:hypothetical protein
LDLGSRAFGAVVNERPEDRERALADWVRHAATLDTAILSLTGENDIPDEGIEAALDDILQPRCGTAASSARARRYSRCLGLAFCPAAG